MRNSHTSTTPMESLSAEALRLLELSPRWLPRHAQGERSPPAFHDALLAWMHGRPQAKGDRHWKVAWRESETPSCKCLGSTIELGVPPGAWVLSAEGRRWVFESLAPLRARGPRG